MVEATHVVAIVDPQPSDYREATPASAYLGPDVLEGCGARVGGVVRLATRRGRRVLARVAGALEAASGGTVRFDRFARQALKAFPHEEVFVERAEVPPADEVVLVPSVEVSLRSNPNFVAQLRDALAAAAAPLCEGMLLYLRLPDSSAGVTYQVHSVAGGEGVCTPDTRLYLEYGEDHEHGPGTHRHAGEAAPARTAVETTYEDIGGLGEQIRAVREFVELPLVFPQVYRQLGIAPPHGVIFHGAPGTGKTLLARAVASEVHARFVYINGPEVVGTYGGQTEENLRRIFAEAGVEPPAIIFIDELDAIAPARGTVGTLSDTRAVTQLLSLMDGLTRTEGVIVIGTTNRVDAIDPALRRAGRFDREVHFPTPPAASREEILRIHTREMPLGPDALDALPEVAARAHGFVGADLMELCREAALNALRRGAGAFLDSPSPEACPSPRDLTVSRADFEGALAAVRPAALRSAFLSVPEVGWSDVAGLEEVKARLELLTMRPLRQPGLWARLGLPPSLGVLLYGPPGNGKTMLAKAVARECGVNLIAVQGPEVFSQWLGESEQAIRQIFSVARRAAPCVVFFDQLDAVAPARGGGEDVGSRAAQRVVSQLLAELDGMAPRDGVIALGATNHIEAVDPALLRPGRFGMHVFVGPPAEPDRRRIIERQLGSAPLAPGVDAAALAADLARRTRGLSGAELVALCQEAKLAALSGAAGEPALAPEHFEGALARTGPRGRAPSRRGERLPRRGPAPRPAKKG